MATLDKLIIFRANNQSHVIYLSELEDEMLLFEFNEFETFGLELIGDRYNVEIECNDYLEDGNLVINEENILIVRPNIRYIISSVDHDLNYFPDTYRIKIFDCLNNNEYQVKFNVVMNQNLGNEGFANIADNLESLISGSSINFLNENLRKNSFDNVNSSTFNFLRIYQEMEQIIWVLQRLNDCLLHDIEKTSKLGYKEGKQTAKTVYLNNVRKEFGDGKSYYSKSVLNFNLSENQLLKNYLEKINLTLIKHTSELQNDLNRRLKMDLNNFNIKKIKNDNSFSSRNYVNQLLMMEARKKDNDNWIISLEKWIQGLKWITNKCQQILDYSPLNKLPRDYFININPTLRFLENPHYTYIKKIYDIVDGRDLKSNLVFSYKKTLEIFELYGFMIIYDLLTELKFEIEDKDLNIFNFASGSRIHFLNANYHAEIYYDYFCQSYRNTSKVDTMVTINSSKCCPDFILCIKDLKTKIVKSFVFEMKYRKYYALSNNNKILNILDDYGQLKYRQENNKMSDVNNVFLIYPSLEDYCEEMSYNGYFIGINFKEKKYKDNSSFKFMLTKINDNIFQEENIVKIEKKESVQVKH